MASTIHPAPPQPGPPSFSRNSTATSLSGMQLSQSHMGSFDASQSHMGSFDASQSVVSTPAATPPPRQLQQSMSFNMGNNGMNNGPMIGPSYRGGLPAAPNGYATYPPQPPPNYKPSIYTAIYSGVSVYEMEVNTIAVMRRRADSWLNATQILKVAGVEKGKRTKVLEKEILPGEHEKVQGGYGKYQGTWISYRRGVEFCRQYGVEELLRPLLEYDMAPDGSSLAGQGGIETPTKEQAMAAQRKRLYGANIESRPPTQSANGTFFKNISNAAVNAVNAISKARYESPGPRQMDGIRRPSSARRPSQQMASQESYPPGSQQSVLSMASQNSFASEGGYTNPLLPDANGDMQEPPRKRMRPSSSQEQFGGDGAYDVSMHEATPTEPNESFVYHQHGFYPNREDHAVGLDPLPQPHGKAAEAKQQVLMALFLDPNQTDFSDHAAFLALSGEELDIPLDPAANTAMHWAATLARTHLLRALIAKGASIFRVNSGGETALLRACVARNNLDKSTFPELLDLLGPTIEIRDGRGRTVLHHIAVSSSIRGRSGAGKYYLESLLEFVIRQGSAPNSQQNSFGPGISSSQSFAPKSISLARFIAEIVNAQDKAGDTALNLAARISNKGIIQQLIEVKADPYIANRGGLKPVDFGIGIDGEQEQERDGSSQPHVSQYSSGVESASLSNKVGESSREMMSNLSSTLADAEEQFAHEIRMRQESIVSVHTKLRGESGSLNEEKRHLESLQSKVSEKAELEQKIGNLRRSAHEYRERLTKHSRTANSTPQALPIVRVGEADTGLEVVGIDVSATPNGTNSALNHTSPIAHLNPTQLAPIASLPSASILRARISAYKRDVENLESNARKLKSKSAELEQRYRSVISLCTGVEEAKVDESLGQLLQAVVSEGKDKGTMDGDERIRAFLELVRAGEE